MQTAQAVHAAFLFSTEFPDVTRQWHAESNYVVALQVPNVDKLLTCFNRCSTALERCIVLEPDLDNEPTAFAVLGAEAGRLLSSLPLVGKVLCPA